MVEETARLLPSEYLERGWVKRILKSGDRYCMLGAILMWDTGSAGGLIRSQRFQQFTEALGLGYRSNSIVPWNNAPERTQAEVVERAKMAEVKLGLRSLADVVESEPVPEVERALELVGVGD